MRWHVRSVDSLYDVCAPIAPQLGLPAIASTVSWDIPPEIANAAEVGVLLGHRGL